MWRIPVYGLVAGLWTWTAVSIGQSAASGIPFMQCFMTSKNDCGRAALQEAGR